MEKSTGVIVRDADLRRAAEAGMDEFIKVFTDAIYDFIGGELNAENIGMLNSDQISLLAYVILRDSVMDGGFVELIQAMREWGLHDLYKIIRKCHRFYMIHHESIEKDCTQEEFDALYEQFPMFDDFDDAFVEEEENFTTCVANYVDEHIDNFAKIVNE